MYYDLVYYLKEFEILKLTYKTNMKNNQINASEKELYKIKNLIRTKLIPELDELDKKLLTSKTEEIDEILEEHPEMENIINNKDEIRKEINSWIKK